MLKDEKLGKHTPRYGNSGYKRRDSDFYATPSWVTEILLKYISSKDLSYGVWEPAAGEGHIVKVIRNQGFSVYPTDIRSGLGYHVEDFLEEKEIVSGHHIITNPPYSLAYEFAKHAIELTKPGNGIVAMLLNNSWDAGQANSKLCQLPSFYKKIVITRRIRWIEGSTGSPRENHSWFLWSHKNTQPPTIHYEKGNI